MLGCRVNCTKRLPSQSRLNQGNPGDLGNLGTLGNKIDRGNPSNRRSGESRNPGNPPEKSVPATGVLDSGFRRNDGFMLGLTWVNCSKLLPGPRVL